MVRECLRRRGGHPALLLTLLPVSQEYESQRRDTSVFALIEALGLYIATQVSSGLGQVRRLPPMPRPPTQAVSPPYNPEFSINVRNGVVARLRDADLRGPFIVEFR